MITAILLDKDGTLLDLRASWRESMNRAAAWLAQGDPALMRRIAAAAGYDPVRQEYRADSPAFVGSYDDVVEAVAKVLPGVTRDKIMQAARMVSFEAGQRTPACDLPALMAELRGLGCALGVATNDDEASAREQLRQLGILDQLDAVLGGDSGFGTKPDPGMLQAFLDQTGRRPDQAAMVGDSLHDLIAARRAGYAWRIGVLTGPTKREELEAQGDLVFDSIAELPGWLRTLES